MTELEGTAFEIFPEKEGNFSDNIEAMPENEKGRLDYFWVAESSSSVVPQFKPDGSETNFTEVRKLHEEGRLEMFYWVPIGSDASEIAGTSSLSGSDFRAFRRARKTVDSKLVVSDDRLYVTVVDGEYLIITPSGEKSVENEDNFEVSDFI